MALTQITEKGIKDGEILNADINASAAIAGTKISPDFGSQGITTTGVISMGNGLTLTGTNPFIDIIDSNNNSDFTVKNDNGTFEIEDKTNSNAVRLAINSSGNVGIGTTSPDQTLHVHKASAGSAASSPVAVITLENSDTSVLQFLTPNNKSAQLRFGDPDSDGAGYIDYSHASNVLTFGVNVSERMRIDSSGRLLVGLTAARDNLANNTSGVAAQIQLEGTSGTKSIMSIVRNTNDGGDGGIVIGKSRGTSVGSTTAVQAGDDLGHITFAGADGTTLQFGAEIKGQVQTGVGNDDMPTALLFSTNGGSTNMVERMRIDPSGKVGIGTSSPSGKLHLSSGTSGDCELIIESDTDNSNESDNPRILFRQDGGIDESAIQNGDNKLEIINSVSNGGIVFKLGTTNGYTNATEKMRFASNGNALFHTTTNDNTIAGAGGIQLSDDANGSFIRISKKTTQAVPAMEFHNANGRVGQIIPSGTSTSYSTSGSDRSLKKNFESWSEDVLALFKNINPQKFNFIQEEDGTEKTKGFIAQEITDSFPEAYIKSFGEDEKYMFNPSGMVVYLMKAIQDLNAKVEALEAK